MEEMNLSWMDKKVESVPVKNNFPGHKSLSFIRRCGTVMSVVSRLKEIGVEYPHH